MIEEILPNLYRAEIPLPRSPLKSLNSYMIKGDGRFLVVDTGMNRKECIEPMQAALKELNVNLDKTDLFITHLHSDHLGLAGTLATDKSRIYFSQLEASSFGSENEAKWQDQIAFFVAHGFTDEEARKALSSHPGYKYSSKKQLKFTCLKEGDQLEIGDYLFKVIETPGHSPCHECLYEASKKILLSGDHILLDITPNITHWSELKNSLKQYLASLDKVYGLDVSLVLPGHRSLWKDHRARIRELREHHKARLEECVSALRQGDKTAWEVAPHVTWDIDCKSWADFPPTQKWFAVGETLAHLEYLEGENKAVRRSQNGRILFSAA